ncbi:MAG: serine kinase [Paracoccus sp. (in: a-proteobacteria)]|nr:serine kinase [Paracoccus sp. (in: a-proteobacteria)]
MPAIRGEVIHASAVALDGRGVVILGAPGAGKSSLAMVLMALGAGLVADDRLRLETRDGELFAAPLGGAATGAAGQARQGGLIEARGAGLIPVPPVGRVPVALAVDLDRTETARLPPIRHTQLLGHHVPLVLGPPGLHLASAICLILRYGRIDPERDFCE